MEAVVMKKRYLGMSVIALGTLITLGACSQTKESGEIVNESNSETVYTDDSGVTIVESTTELKDDGFFKLVVGEGRILKSKISFLMIQRIKILIGII